VISQSCSFFNIIPQSRFYPQGTLFAFHLRVEQQRRKKWCKQAEAVASHTERNSLSFKIKVKRFSRIIGDHTNTARVQVTKVCYLWT